MECKHLGLLEFTGLSINAFFYDLHFYEPCRSQKQSKHMKSKDVGESDNHSRMNDETSAHKKRDSVESDEQKSATGNPYRMSIVRIQ
jgi:hypothetical protein